MEQKLVLGVERVEKNESSECRVLNYNDVVSNNKVLFIAACYDV